MNMGSELVSLYKKIEPYLIDAFVKYYGEEHRYKIENLINNLTIILLFRLNGTMTGGI